MCERKRIILLKKILSKLDIEMIKSILDFIFEIIALEESRVWRGSGLDWTVCLDISRWAFQTAGDISLIVGKKKRFSIPRELKLKKALAIFTSIKRISNHKGER